MRVGVSLIDQGTGVWAALAIVAALHEGEGRELDLSLFETGVSLVPYHVMAYLATGETPGRHGTAFPLIVPYQAFAARDGELMVATPNDRLFAALLRALELPEDPRFATNPERVAHRDEVVALLAGRFAEEDVGTWLERLAEAGVPAAPVNDVGQVARAEQTHALGLLQPLPHPDAPDLVEVAPPLSVDGERLRHRSPPPRLGEHSAEVLAEAGYSSAEIERLFAAGVVAGPGPVDVAGQRPAEHPLEPLRDARRARPGRRRSRFPRPRAGRRGPRSRRCRSRAARTGSRRCRRPTRRGRSAPASTAASAFA